MDPNIQRAIGDLCNQFEAQTRIGVTDQTRELAAQNISAIVEDPHPRWQWRNDPQQLQNAQQLYVNAVPFMLFQVVASERVRDRITAFDFLHWFSKSFELTMCVIPK